jgi:MYXO-CTERM domain-containing protein
VQAWLRTSGESMNYDGGCSVADGSSSASAVVAVALALLALTLRRRRLVVVAALVGLTAARTARADGDDHRGLRAAARASMSVQNPAYAIGLAGAYGWRRAEVGVFAELNPWYDANKEMLAMGSTNFGVFAHYLHPLRQDLRLRAGLGLGLSVLNQSLPGTSAGNVGLDVNVRLLGLVWYFAERTALTIDAFDLAIPTPQLTGWPVSYAQHRFSVGLSF